MYKIWYTYKHHIQNWENRNTIHELFYTNDETNVKKDLTKPIITWHCVEFPLQLHWATGQGPLQICNHFQFKIFPHLHYWTAYCSRKRLGWSGKRNTNTPFLNWPNLLITSTSSENMQQVDASCKPCAPHIPHPTLSPHSLHDSNGYGCVTAGTYSQTMIKWTAVKLPHITWPFLFLLPPSPTRPTESNKTRIRHTIRNMQQKEMLLKKKHMYSCIFIYSYRYRGPGFDSRHCQIFLSSSGSETGSTQPREPPEVNWGATWIKKSSGSRSRKQSLTAVGTCCADHATPLYPQKLALTSPTGGGRSVGIVRSRTKATEFFMYIYIYCMSVPA